MFMSFMFTTLMLKYAITLVGNMDNGSVCEPNHSEMEQTTSQSALIESEDGVNALRNIEDNDNLTLPTLPNEMWLKIFNYLSPKHLRGINLVCRDWYELARAPELTRKLKLIITEENLKDIYDFMVLKELQYENVKIGRISYEFSAMEHEILLNIFIKLGSSVVELQVYSLSTLLVLNDVLPNLKALDLSHCEKVDDRAPVDLNKFPNLKSLSMPDDDNDNFLSQLLPNSTEKTRIELEGLSVGGYDSNAMFLKALAAQASSLRWLKLRECIRISDISLDQLRKTFKKCTQLKTLDIQEASYQGYKAVILERLPEENNIEVLDNDFLEESDKSNDCYYVYYDDSHHDFYFW
uniref:F-box domain-containing protein n=1 Tax=Glossina brevipalpis TaxID=37001 RepID=A0A1A9X3V0_9MUSC